MSNYKNLSNISTIIASQKQVSSELSGEAVILNMESGLYYGLNQTGASIWNLIQQPKTVGEIKNAILAEYEVEPEQCDRDVLALLQELVSQGLIEVKNEATS